MTRAFDLLSRGHLTPPRDIALFGFDDAAAAFESVRSAQHMRPVVLTTTPAPPDNKPTDGFAASAASAAAADASPAADSPTKATLAPPEVTVRPAPRSLALRPDAAYLIVGGLRGLCGSLALHLAEYGARHLVVMSRSGCADEQSQAVVKGCAALGCRVHDAKGDVTRADDVRRVFEQAPAPIAGVIQGAMVLRVRTRTPFSCAYFMLRFPATSTLQSPSVRPSLPCCLRFTIRPLDPPPWPVTAQPRSVVLHVIQR